MPFINGIGPGELIIILIIALLVVGPGKLPDVGSALGKSIREFRKASTDVKEATSLAPTPPAPTQPAPTQPSAADTAQPTAIGAPIPPIAPTVTVGPVASAVTAPAPVPIDGAPVVAEVATEWPAELAPVDVDEQQPTPST